MRKHMRKHTLTGKMDAQVGMSNSHTMEINWEFSEEPAQRDYAKYVAGESLVHMVKEDLAARRIAVECCRDIIHYIGDHDPDTRHRLESVLEVEGERAGESANHFKL